MTTTNRNSTKAITELSRIIEYMKLEPNKDYTLTDLVDNNRISNIKIKTYLNFLLKYDIVIKEKTKASRVAYKLNKYRMVN